MKKYLLMASAFLMAAMTVSCDKGPDDNGGGNGKTDPDAIKFTEVTDAVYRGEKHGEGTGFFTFTLNNADGDKMRIDCFGSVSVNSTNARFTTGEYKPGSVEDHTIFTFVTADNASAEEGTIYWKGTEAYPVGGGTMKVTASGGNYKLAINFTSGDKTIEAEYEGAMKFTGRPEFAPREDDPNPRPVKNVSGLYLGRMAGDSKTGGFMLDLVYEGDPETGKNVEKLAIAGYMNFPEDNNNAFLPEGTYTVSSSDDTEDAFSLVSGMVSTEGYGGTCEVYYDGEGAITKGYMISEGTMVIAKNGDNYKITATMKGKRADKTAIVGTEFEEIVYEYEGPLDPLDNMADPMSNMTGDLDLGIITNQALVQTGNIGPNKLYTGWFYFLWDEGLHGSFDSEGNFDLVGEGNMVLVAIAGPNQSTVLPEAEYPMGPKFMFWDEKGSAMPGTYTITEVNAASVGCWYAYTKSEGNVLNLAKAHMGAVADKGFVKTSNNGNEHTVEFEFYDRNGYKLTGKYVGEVEVYKGNAASAAASESTLQYSPSYDIYMGETPLTAIMNMFR